MKKTRVLIVDDHPLFRAGIVQLLSLHTDLTVCGEVDDARKVMAAIRTTKPHVVTLDITIGDRDGLEVLKQIQSDVPQKKVLVLSMHDESVYAPRALLAGAAGYMNKTQAPENLIAAIRAILTGEIWLSQELKRRFLGFRRTTKRAATRSVESLTDRQLEILGLIGRGIGTKEIAQTLGLSTKTIESHRGHIRGKLNLRDGAELVCYAIKWVDRERSGSPSE